MKQKSGLPVAGSINRAVYLLAVASWISEMGIILTGGAVRVTGSGLGCSEWPRCTPESMTPTSELGIHGMIEFGNRLLTFVLAGIALALVLMLWKQRSHYRMIINLAIGLMLTIPIQAVIGGITVWTKLNPWVVACHFLVSAVMVSVATALLVRVSTEYRVSSGSAPSGQPVVDGETTALSRGLAAANVVLMAIAVFLGTVVTGTGPHAGDPNSPRHLFDLEAVARLHVIPVWLMVFATVVLAVEVFRRSARSVLFSPAQKRSVLLMVAVLVYQGGIGYLQYFTGVPIGLVLLHLIGTGLSVSAVTYAADKQLSRYRAHSRQA